MPWQAVIETRNRLAHGYFDIDLEIIWDTIQKDIPDLIRSIKRNIEIIEK